MAAWSDHEDWDYLETYARTEADRSLRLGFLMRDGRRRDVIIDSAHDSPDIRSKIGEALAANRTGIGRKGNQK